MRIVRFCAVLMCLAGFGRADEVADLARTRTRAAWDKVVAKGPAVLPRLLEAMDTPDTVTANWLYTAFERIVEAAGKDVDADMLLKFAADRKRQGRARRLALETAERLRPGCRARLIKNAIDDAEFRFEAIDLALGASGKKDEMQLRRLFSATRDLAQARQVQTKLKEIGVEVSVADHMGFPRDWYVVGPFDAKGMKGFKTEYPPEKSVDLKAAYEGKDGKRLAWKRLSVPETKSGGHVALVNLHQALGAAQDAVGYAWTALRVKEAGEVEFRGAADDNFSVWVNGERVFGFEEYRNGVRLDRHRFKVKLKAGLNTVLVKVCQAPGDANAEPNWEFLLRLCDETGKGIAFKPELP
jgi:hypothetical protein